MQETAVKYRYKAFISYSHAGDRQFAKELQDALQRYAKKWYRPRAFRVFRDENDLHAAPEAWPVIEQALKDSEFFIVLASPEAAESKWVKREIELWKDLGRSDRLILVQTAGNLYWDDEQGDFDPKRSTALPHALLGAFQSVPLYCDVHEWARQTTLDVFGNSEHQSAICKLAAPLHGVPKADLVRSREQAEHRRMLHTAWSVSAALLVLLLVAVGFWWQSHVRYKEGLARKLVAESQVRRENVLTTAQSVLLALEAGRLSSSAESASALREAVWMMPRELVRFRYTGNPKRGVPPAFAVSLDAAGRMALSGSAIGSAICWVDRGTCKPLPFWNAPVWAVALSADGTKAAVGDQSGEVRLYRIDEQSFASASEYRHTACVNTLELSPDGARVMSGSADGTVTISAWPATDSYTLKPNLKGSSIESVRFSPDGQTFAVGDADGGFFLYRIGDPKPLREFHLDGKTAEIAFSPNGSKVAWVSWRGILKTFDVNTGRSELSLHVADTNYSVTYDPSGSLIGVGAGIMAYVIDANSGRIVLELQADDSVSSVAFSASGDFLTGSVDGGMRAIDVATRQLSGGFRHAGGVNRMAAARSRDRFATVSRDGTMRVFDLGDSLSLDPTADGPLLVMNQRGAVLQQRSDHQLLLLDRARGLSRVIPFSGSLTAAAISADSTLIAPASEEKLVDVRRTLDGLAVFKAHEVPDTLMSVEFSPDQRWVAAGGWWDSGNGFATVLDAATGKVLFADDRSNEVRAVAVDSKRSRLALGEFNGNIELLQLSPARNAMGELGGNEISHFDVLGSPKRIALSSDGKWVAVATMSGNVELHEAQTGALALRLRAEGDVVGVWFVNGDSRLSVARRRGSVVRMLSTPLTAKAIESEACSRVGRPLSQGEWDLFLEAESFRMTCLSDF